MATKGARGAGCAIIAMLLMCLIAPAGSSAATIDAGELDVTTADTGGMQARYANASLFANTTSAGFVLRFADGPLSGQTRGPGWVNWDTRFTPVSQSAVTRSGDMQSQQIVYAALDGIAEVARVTQTARVRDGARTFRMTYDVENRTGQPLRLRATTGGELYLDNTWSSSGYARSGPPRFVGAEASYSGVRGGVEQVLQSQLSGDGAPVAVSPWSAAQLGSPWSIETAIAGAAGLTDGVRTTSTDSGLAVQWDDHLAEETGIAAGASARYEVVWHTNIAPRLKATTDKSDRYIGSSHTIDLAVSDDLGSPAAGAALRWSVTGTHPRAVSSPLQTDAAGNARISYAGERAGSDTITVFADLDGNSVRSADEPQRISYVYWESPLSISQTEHGWRVGQQQGFTVTLRTPAGTLRPDAEIRWSVAGVNPTSTVNVMRTSANGTALITVTARRAGSDMLTVFVDTDGDAFADPDELLKTHTLRWEPPPPQVTIESWNSPRVPAAGLLTLTLRDALGVVIPDGALRWWAEGANSSAPASVRSSATGTASLSIPSVRSGMGTVWVHHDRDEDGVQDAGEATASQTVTVSPALPPAVTRKTLDGAGLDVTVSSVGGLQASFDALPGIPRRNLFEESYGGVFVRVLDGPLAGQTYASNGNMGSAFFGDPQQEPTRTGDTVVQRSSWTARSWDRDHLRVHQVARLRDGEDSVRLTWSVENLGDAPVRMRIGTIGDVYIEGDDTGAAVTDGGSDFAGIEHPSGFAAGIEGVQTSRLPGETSDTAVPAWTGSAFGTWTWDLVDRVWSGSLVTAAAPPVTADNVGVEWSDHIADGQALAVGAAASARYEAVWRLRRPSTLRVSPPSDVAETRHEHKVTATLLDDDALLPRNGVKLRWAITGKHPQQGSALSAGLGQVVIAWTGTRIGKDTVTIFADEDDDGVRDPGEARRAVTVDWRAETAVDPPRFSPLTTPNGTQVAVNLVTQGLQNFFQVTPSAVSSFPKCADGSPQVNVTMSVNIDGAAGTVVAGSVSLLTLNPSTLDLLHPIDSILPLGPAVDDTFQFVIDCLRQTSIYVCYELEELGLPIERFCVQLGGMGFYDPSGVVYDAPAAHQLVKDGVTPTEARRQAAIEGASVILERSFEGAFRRVLSGDPFVTPNVNPMMTDAEGRFAWNVSPGTYRVVASADGYRSGTSRSATIPPPDLDVHVGLYPEGSPEPEPGTDPMTPPPAVTPPPPPPPAATPPPPPPAATPPPPPPPAATPPPPPPPPPAATPPPPPPAATPPPPPPPPPAAPPAPRPSTPPPPPAPRVQAPSAPAAPTAPRTAPCELRAVGKPKVDGRGVVRVTIACREPGLAWSGKITVKGSGREALGSVRAGVPAGKGRTVTLRLSAKAKAALRRSRSKRISVIALSRGSSSVLGTSRVALK